MKHARILVADDDRATEAAVEQALRPLGNVEMRIETDASAVAKSLESGSFDLVMVALRPPAIDGFAILKAAQEIDRRLPGRPVGRQAERGERDRGSAPRRGRLPRQAARARRHRQHGPAPSQYTAAG